MDYEGLIIERLNHDCFKIKAEKVIYFDPYNLLNNLEFADVIFITHSHADHCSPIDIAKIIKSETIIVTVPDCQSKLSNLEVAEVILVEPGKILDLSGLKVEIIPAYNTNKFRSPGIPFHPKENQWVGYIVTIAGKRIYHAGDTDVISEMSNLKDIDIALLPVSGTYVMTAIEAVEACKKINPKLAIPMHYGSIVGTASDAEKFKNSLSSFCKVEII